MSQTSSFAAFASTVRTLCESDRPAAKEMLVTSARGHLSNPDILAQLLNLAAEAGYGDLVHDIGQALVDTTSTADAGLCYARALAQTGHTEEAAGIVRGLIAAGATRAIPLLEELRQALCARWEQVADALATAAAQASLLHERIVQIGRASDDRVFMRLIETSDGRVQEFTYTEIVSAAALLASGFRRQGMETGDRLVIVLNNQRDVFVAGLGAMISGLVPIIASPHTQKISYADYSSNLSSVIKNVQPKLVVADVTSVMPLKQFLDCRIIDVDSLRDIDTGCGFIMAGGDTAFIQYTSGTTGLKKGIKVSPKALLWQVDAYAKCVGISQNDHIVSWLPYYHDMGLIACFMLPLLRGVSITLMSPFLWLERPCIFLDALARHKGTLCWLPNFAYDYLVRTVPPEILPSLDLSCVRGFVNCSEPLRESSHQKFLRYFSPCGVTPTQLASSYAMAENTFAVTSGGFADDPLPLRMVDTASLRVGALVAEGPDALVSSGQALPQTRIVVTDRDGRVLPPDHFGLINIRSPCLMSGYFEDDERTMDAFRNGLYVTGDLGFLSSSGHLYITGRSDDIIIIAGQNFSPQNIESVVNDVEGVVPGRCVAFGIPIDSIGTSGLVIVAESRRKEEGIREIIRRKVTSLVLSRFDVSPHDVVIVDHMSLIKSSSGKISRKRNALHYIKEIRKVEIGPPPDDTEGLVHWVVRSVIRKPVFVGQDDELLSSGLIDSLSMIDVILALEERIGRRLPPPSVAGFHNYNTIARIIRLIQDMPPLNNEEEMYINDRIAKWNNYQRSNPEISCLILGTSRSSLLSASMLTALGMPAYNFSLNSARGEDILAAVTLFSRGRRSPLEQVWIGIDPELFHPDGTIDERTSDSREMMAIIDEAEAQRHRSLNRRPPTDTPHARYLSRLARRGWSNRPFGLEPRTGDYLLPTIEEERKRTGFSMDDETACSPYSLMLARQIVSIHGGRLDYFTTAVDMALAAGTRVNLYVNMMHPALRAILRRETPYLSIQDDLVNRLRERWGERVRLFDFQDPESIGGEPRDFIDDGRHPGFLNNHLIMKSILEHNP